MFVARCKSARIQRLAEPPSRGVRQLTWRWRLSPEESLLTTPVGVGGQFRGNDMNISIDDKKRLAKLKKRKRLLAMSNNDLSKAWQDKKVKASIPQFVELRDMQLKVF
jgi:hypothetical protein